MKIACLSGKGGAGKTLLAVNLAALAGKCTYIDCDVEEPNGRLFLRPQSVEEQAVSCLLPEFDSAKCSGCKKCVDFCRFHALVYIKDKPMLFPEVCHSCGGCSLVCPHAAVSEKASPIGRLEIGRRGDTTVVTGILNPGEASGVPLIREALRHSGELTIIDCPPGSACSVMECVMEADYCLLVAEATAFGFHNFKMVHELCSLLNKPCGLVINKQEQEYAPLEDYCAEHGLPVLGRIAYDGKLAKLGAEGMLAVESEAPLYRDVFQSILNRRGVQP